MPEKWEPKKSLINSKKAEPLDFEPIGKVDPEKDKKEAIKKKRPRAPKKEDGKVEIVYDPELGEPTASLHEKPEDKDATKNKNKAEKMANIERKRQTKERNEESKLAVPLFENRIAKMDLAIEKAKSKESYTYFVKRAQEIIKERGIDRIVVHGNPITDARLEIWETEHKNKEGKPIVPEKFKLKDAPPVEINPDLDVMGALYLLDKIHEVKPEIYNEGIYIESVPKGDVQGYEAKKEKREVILVLDTGNTHPRIEEGEGGKDIIYADHHGEKGTFPTSATKIIYDIFESTIIYNKTLAAEAEKLKKISAFITKFDNLQFLDDINKGKERTKVFNSNFFVHKFSRSLYTLAKVLPFETTLEMANDPTKFNLDGKKNHSWLDAFPNEEIENGELGKIIVSIQDTTNRLRQRTLTIKEYVRQMTYEYAKANEGVNIQKEYMQANGINEESPYTGNTLFFNYPEVEITTTKGVKKKTKNTIKQNIAYLAAKANEYDAIVFSNPETGGLFVNADGKHALKPISNQLQQIIPGYPDPTRDIFLFSPKDPEKIEKLKKISEEERLQIIGLHTEKYTEIKHKKLDELEIQKRMYNKEEEDLEEKIAQLTKELEG